MSGTREGLTTFGMNPADRFPLPLNFKKECKEKKKSVLNWGLNYISEITAELWSACHVSGIMQSVLHILPPHFNFLLLSQQAYEVGALLS